MNKQCWRISNGSFQPPQEYITIVLYYFSISLLLDRRIRFLSCPVSPIKGSACCLLTIIIHDAPPDNWLLSLPVVRGTRDST